MIEETWKRLERRLRVGGASDQLIAHVRRGFVGALYAAAGALVTGGTVKEVSETAFRIESQK